MARSKSDWPIFKDMVASVLREGPGDGVVLPIAPTMRYLTYKGERYFRMPQSRATLEDGSMGGSYLWTGWCPGMKPCEFHKASDG